MIEQSIEANIISKLEALGLSGLAVSGSWQAVAVGKVKGQEDDGDAPATLYVAVSPRSFVSNGLPEATFDVAISLVIRTDLCPTGDALETYCDPIARLLQAWSLATFADSSDAHGFDVPGFAPGGIQFSGGTAPESRRDAAVWAVVFSLVISGVVGPEAAAEPTQPTPTE